MVWRVRRARDGTFKLKLPPEERAVLRSLPAQLRELVADGDDPSLERLFPPAYTGDREKEDEYRRLMGDDLLRHHLEALDAMEATVDAERLDAEQMSAWLHSLNQLRLVLGTRLDVSEDMDLPDPDDPNAAAFHLYLYLGWLQEQVVEALLS